MSKPTGLKDKNGKEIFEGNFVSLDGNITADDSFGILPNGWTFDENDIYEVYFDERCNGGGNWSLKLGVEPDSPYNRKYMNHAVGLLHGEAVEIVDAPPPEKISPAERATIFLKNKLRDGFIDAEIKKELEKNAE